MRGFDRDIWTKFWKETQRELAIVIRHATVALVAIGALATVHAFLQAKWLGISAYARSVLQTIDVAFIGAFLVSFGIRSLYQIWRESRVRK